MKRFFSFSFQYRVIFVFLLFMNLSFVVTGYIAKNMTEGLILQEKKNKLVTIARILDTRLDRGGFDALLLAHSAENESRDEKIRILSRILRETTDEVGNSAPGLGVGYYSKELDAIITYGPSISFGGNVGISIPADHPGREVMEKNATLVQSGTMVRGDILNAMVPIERGGKVIGYIWANELTTDITDQLNTMTRNIFLVMALSCAVIFVLLILLSRRTIRDVDRIITGVRAMREDLNSRIEGSGGDLGELVDNINEMAADISKAKEESDRAVAVLQTLMDNVDAMIYVCDPATKTLVYTNGYLHRLLKRGDVTGSRCFEILYGNTEPCRDCPQNDLFDEYGNPVHETISREVHNNLFNRDFHATDRLVTWHDGRLLHMEVGADISERNALTVAEAANAAQRDFLARMSQEISGPMNRLLSATEEALEAAPTPAQEDYLKRIQTSANQMMEMISDILDYSRIEAGMLTMEKQVFNVRDMIQRISDLIQPRVNAQYQDFSVDVDDSVPEYAIGDSLRLSQVLLNLLDNAVRFTINGSILLQVTSQLSQMRMLRLNFVVRDAGIGMSREQLQSLFEPLSPSETSVLRAGGGSMLGMAISKALVEMMGGTISVSSTAGVGTEFVFHVEFEPLYGVGQDGEEVDAPWRVARYDGTRMLLVEDNLVNRDMIREMLEELGVQVDVVSNGVDAVRSFLQNDYDMIFMDVRMPIMDGLETTRRIRASSKHDAATVPVVAMTANTLLEDRRASKDAGMNAHIAKPVDVNEFRSILYQQLRDRAGR